MSVLDFLFKKQKRRQYQYSHLSLNSSDIRKIMDEWSRVEELVRLGQPSQLRQAVIKADNLLDFALKRLAIGTTMGERLKTARSCFKEPAVYRALWEAHKVRNALVHEADYEPPHFVVKEALGKFKRGFESLGATLE